MKRLTITLLFVFVLSVALPVAVAQSDTPTCNPSALIADMAKMKSAGDDAKDVTALVELRDRITAQNVACNGYKFEGRSGKSLGPVEIPNGKYLLTVTTDGYIILKAELLGGGCMVDGDQIGKYALFGILKGQASEGAATVIDSDSCRV